GSWLVGARIRFGEMNCCSDQRHVSKASNSPVEPPGPVQLFSRPFQTLDDGAEVVAIAIHHGQPAAPAVAWSQVHEGRRDGNRLRVIIGGGGDPVQRIEAEIFPRLLRELLTLASSYLVPLGADAA